MESGEKRLVANAGETRSTARMLTTVRGCASFGVFALCTLIAIILTHLAWQRGRSLHSTSHPSDPLQVISTIEAATFGLAALITGWFALITALICGCYLARATRHSWHWGERNLRALSPRIARIALTTLVGVGASTATLAPAHALPDEYLVSDEEIPQIDLSWAAQTEISHTPVPQAGSLGQAAAAPKSSGQTKHESPAQLTTSSTEELITVKPGDSLWSISAARLQSDATNLQIDAAWRALYEVNQTVIGPDPDFLLPGTQLMLPP